ncbi:unnamed protein product [Ilex paraguariensis]|uniref:Uncharacterized protein n=1 Tax=Ilex paraguariensis TaxID=185542 RepID=A0ABC8ULS7_9AQUA
MTRLGKQGAAKHGGGQLSLLLLLSLPYDKQTLDCADGGTSPLAQKSHGSTSVHIVPLLEGHVEHNVDEEDDNFINDNDIEEDSYSDDTDKDDTFIKDECDSD